MFTRISKREAIKRFNAGLPFVLCPVKLCPGSPWAPHYPVHPDTIAEVKQDAIDYGPESSLWEGTVERTAWGLLYRNWAHYNTSWEEGYYAAYYLED